MSEELLTRFQRDDPSVQWGEVCEAHEGCRCRMCREHRTFISKLFRPNPLLTYLRRHREEQILDQEDRPC